MNNNNDNTFPSVCSNTTIGKIDNVEKKKEDMLQVYDNDTEITTNINYGLGIFSVDNSDNNNGELEEKPLSDDNRGYKLLMKMGWKKGNGLGKKGNEGIKNPIVLNITYGLLGLGQYENVSENAELATKERKKLDIELMDDRQKPENREMLEHRIKEYAKSEKIALDVKKMNESFFCQDCNKQYSKVAEYNNHLQSYDHHHVKRLKELKERERRMNNNNNDSNKKRKAEQRKEDKELQRRLAAAATLMNNNNNNSLNNDNNNTGGSSSSSSSLVDGTHTSSLQNNQISTSAEILPSPVVPLPITTMSFGFGSKKKLKKKKSIF